MHLEELQRFMVSSKDLEDSGVMTPILIHLTHLFLVGAKAR